MRDEVVARDHRQVHVDDRGVDRVPDTIKSYPRLGNVDELVAFCRSATVDLLIVTLPLTAETAALPS